MAAFEANHVIVVGGGLAGLAAAATLLEKGCFVTILEKHERAGGASSKATCGIAAPGSTFQKESGVQDNANDLLENEEAKQLVTKGSEAVDWLITTLRMKADLALVDSPGHSTKRVIGAKDNFPGAVLTYKTLQVLQLISKSNPNRLQIICDAEVTNLKTEGTFMVSKVTGVEYKLKDGERKTVMGAVVLATGGYTGDLSGSGLLARHVPGYSPNMAHAIDKRARGDGIDLSVAVGAGTADLDTVSFYPMGMSIPGREQKPFKMCIADTLCGAGAVILNARGDRVVKEKDNSEARFSQMCNDEYGEFYFAMPEAVAKAPEVKWLVDFYETHNFFTMYGGPHSFAKAIGADPHKVEQALGMKGKVLAAKMLPVLHTSLGGVMTGFGDGKEGKVLKPSGSPIDGLYAAGEVTNVPYKKIWESTGIPLLHAVYTGKMAGDAAAAFVGKAQKVEDLVHLTVPCDSDHGHGHDDVVKKEPAKDIEKTGEGKKLEDLSKEELIAKIKDLEANGVKAAAAPAKDEGPPGIKMDEVAKHKSKDDAWIVLFGNVYDVTNWIPKHPGGEQAIQVFLGMDATEEWKNIHKPGTLENKNYSQHFKKLGALDDGKPKAAAGAAPAEAGGIQMDEVKKHTTKEAGLWIVINGMVLDVTEFTKKHPGGEPVLMANAGTDASSDWNGIHKPGTVEKWLKIEGGPVLKGNFAGGGAVTATADAEPEEEWLIVDGDGKVPGIIGSSIYLVLNVARMLLRTVFGTGNFKFKLDNNRKGTIQSAILLLTFTIVHVGGNFVDMVMNKSKASNGEGATLPRLAGGDLKFKGHHLLLELPGGHDLSILEIYFLAGFVVHISVALKRSWDISINYCLYTGKWNMMLSGLFVLAFLVKHLSDLKFGNAPEVWMRLPKYMLDLPPHIWYEEYGSADNGSFGSICRKVRDTYTLQVKLFKDIPTALFYSASILLFIYHMVRGWEKLVTAEMMQIPTGHVKRITYMGWLLAVALGSLYLTVLWFTFFATADTIMDDPTCVPK
mmetsp:Transcript_162897/g.312888  ORF Transcript_162897/g.312888 Transcript_162897/m.312888 type:complete len:1014 (+) Transcript_162897:129-3170(+)